MNAPRIPSESALEHLQNAQQMIILGANNAARLRAYYALLAFKEGNYKPGDYERISNEAGRL